MMAALFIDLDGTCLGYHTNEWLPGVVDRLTELNKQGHQIHFITMTGPQDAEEVYNESARRALVAGLPFSAQITTAVQSPRVLIDDSETFAVRTRTNSADWLNAIR